MKEGLKKNIIISSYWVAIGVLVWLSREKEMPGIERLASFLCFSFITIVISIAFSKTLFQRTIHNRKTSPFAFKFIMMTALMGVCFVVMAKGFASLEAKGIFQSRFYLDGDVPFFSYLGNSMPGLIAGNVIFCVILLYYEYSVLKQANLESQLKVLHAQINPHFMFNVLNYLHVLMQKDTELASTLLLKYSDTLRYQLYSGKKETVKLDQEIRFLKDFIDVEKFRWEDKLDVDCVWMVEDGSKDIPPLLFIPFIENAFKHVSRSAHNKGFIHIRLEQKGRFISLDVENSKSNSPAKTNKSTGIGLENIKARLKIHYGRLYSLQIKETDSVYSSKLKICT